MPPLALGPSSNIATASYEPEIRMLSVTFLHGGTYRYSGVDQDTVSGFESAASPGTYFAERIKNKFAMLRG